MLFYCIRAMTPSRVFCLLKTIKFNFYLHTAWIWKPDHEFHTPYLQDRKGSFKGNQNPLALVEYSFGHPMLISIPATSLSLKEMENFFSILEKETYIFPSNLFHHHWGLNENLTWIWTFEFLASPLFKSNIKILMMVWRSDCSKVSITSAVQKLQILILNTFYILNPI